MYAPLLKIIEAIGLPAAMKLVENFGGMRLHWPLPENIDERNDIARAIGVDAARKLAAAWGPDDDRRPSIPLARRHLRIIARLEIRRDAGSMTVPELARKYETTERNIYRYLGDGGEGEPGAKQPGLF